MENGMEHKHSKFVEIDKKITATLVFHFIILSLTFGLILPYGFAAKQGRSPRHLLIMSVGGVLAVIGTILGHFTGVPEYNPWLADIATLWALLCVGGSFLLLIYVPKGILYNVRNILNKVHIAVCTVQPLVCWVFCGLGFVSFLQWCKKDHLGQCLAHGIMGTAFVTYGAILLIMLYCGEHFLDRTNRSQEWYDSLVITLWGIINTFTEHRWGKEGWGHGDVQHTSMGIVWWACGMVGLYRSWNRVKDCPQRNHWPAIIIMITGYAMMTHVQNLPISTNIHFMFGVMLMAAGLARVIEVSFVMKDRPHRGLVPHSWQYVAPFLLFESGILFMSATEEAMFFLDSQGIMAAPYVLLGTSIAGICFLMTLFTVESYVVMRRQNSEDTHGKEEGIELRPFMAEDARDFEISE